jgi:tight adherence protein B
MFVSSVNILKETGGNLAETFSTIVQVVRERQKVEKKIEAMTAQGIMQGVIISVIPFAILGIFVVVDPAYVMPLFTKPLGWFFLLLMVGLIAIGGILIRKLVTIKV